MNVKIDFRPQERNNTYSWEIQIQEEKNMNLSSTIEKGSQYFGNKKVIFVTDFPKTLQGKILKRELRKY